MRDGKCLRLSSTASAHSVRFTCIHDLCAVLHKTPSFFARYRKAASSVSSPQECKALVCSEEFPITITYRSRMESFCLPYGSSPERRPEDCFCSRCTQVRRDSADLPLMTCALVPVGASKCAGHGCSSTRTLFCVDTQKHWCRRHCHTDRRLKHNGRERTTTRFNYLSVIASVADPNNFHPLQVQSPLLLVTLHREKEVKGALPRGAAGALQRMLTNCSLCPPEYSYTSATFDAFSGEYYCSAHFPRG